MNMYSFSSGTVVGFVAMQGVLISLHSPTYPNDRPSLGLTERFMGGNREPVVKFPL